MPSVNINSENYNFPEIIDRVTELGERIVVEQPGKAKVAIIAYDDLKRLEALEEILLKKAEVEEYEWLKAAIKNSAFDELKDESEDIYTLADGKPYIDCEWAKAVINDPDFYAMSQATIDSGIADSEPDIYTLNDGKPFHDEG